MRNFTRSFAALAAVALASACASRESSFQKVYEKPAAPPQATAIEQSKAALAAGAAAWAKRDDRAQADAAIKAWSKAAELDPTNGDVRANLARAHYYYAEAFLRDEASKDQLLATLEKGTTWGEESIVILSPEFAKRAAANEKFEEAVKVADAKAIAGLYWYGVNLGRWARAKGIATLLGNKDKAKAVMDRVLELDEKFFYGAPHRYFGAYYSLLPSIAGRDPDKSKEHFEKSLAIEPKYVGTKVLYADTYAVKTQNKDLFKKLLDEAIASPDDVIPELAAETKVEKQKAAALLKQIDDLF